MFVAVYSFFKFLIKKTDSKNLMHISEMYSRVHFPVSTPQFVHICASTENKLSDMNILITGEEPPNAKKPTGD